jgi:hypothetical protein
MIKVEAEFLSSSMQLYENNHTYRVKPFTSGKTGLMGALERFASTFYEIIDEKGVIVSRVYYDGKKDMIVIKKDNEEYCTEHRWFNPYEFFYKDVKYHIHESITGKLIIRRKDKVVAKGKCGFKSVIFDEYTSELEPVLKELAVGYCIKMLVWFMFV